LAWTHSATKALNTQQWQRGQAACWSITTCLAICTAFSRRQVASARRRTCSSLAAYSFVDFLGTRKALLLMRNDEVAFF
jgi:hypothetical protein